MKVMSLRLDEEDISHIKDLSREEKKDKSEAARELLHYGWIFHRIKLYRMGKTSLGKLSRELSLPLSEAIDLLAEFGIESPLDYGDYLEGFSNL